MRPRLPIVELQSTLRSGTLRPRPQPQVYLRVACENEDRPTIVIYCRFYRDYLGLAYSQ